jgi:KaiC/GvpD/RAD55 family RecA-like ATPase
MTDTFRLLELGIAHFEHVFSPAGLPLVDKGDAPGGTTSILVRGSAGSGKTTLGLALAHAVARHHGGVVLCLSTEFSPAEIVFKAQVLDLPDGTVSAWPGGNDPPEGSILVQALSTLAAAERVDGSSSRKLAAIEALHELLEPADGRRVPAVRAVLLDALTLPGNDEQEDNLRERLLEMIQGLEHRGITTVLVEEAAPGASEWAAFVVDIVLELSFVADPETGELNRKLACRKSRYAFSLPGPHDYGLTKRRPSIWPSIARIIQSTPKLLLARLRVVLPGELAEQWTEFRRGGIAVSHYDEQDTRLLSALQLIPGAVEVSVKCGPSSLVGYARGGTRVPDHDGPWGLAWAILEAAKQFGANICVIHQLEFFLARQSWKAPLSHMLQALADAGLIVVVHGTAAGLQELRPLASFVSDRYALTEQVQHARYCRAERWWVAQALCRSSDSEPSADALLQQLWAAQTPEELATLKGPLSPEPPYVNAKPLLVNLRQGPAPLDMKVARVLLSPSAEALVLDDEWAAANAAFTALGHDAEDTNAKMVWYCVQGVVARNAKAVDAVATWFDATQDSWVFGSLCHGLARTDRIAVADERIRQLVIKNELPPWFGERFQAELRIAPANEAGRREAKARLEQLAAQSELPLLHRAEIELNLGVVLSLLGETTAAAGRYRAALEKNPELIVAREHLEKLAAPRQERELPE